MDLFQVVAIALGLGVPVVFALVLSIIFFAGKPRPVEGLGPRPTVKPTPARAPGSWSPPSGRWNALILANGPFGALGGSLGATGGVFEVSGGHLGFTPVGQTAPTWSVPCAQVAARANTAFATAGVLLWTPRGQMRCNVSREHINRFSRNTIKTLREPKYYREFVDVLVANGARWA